MAHHVGKGAGRRAEPALVPLSDIPEWAVDQEMTILLTAPDGTIADNGPVRILPLTTGAGLNQSDTARQAINVRGTLEAADASTYANISGSNAIPFISCDSTNASFVSQSEILQTLISHAPRAILLYSTTSASCLLRNAFQFPSLYTTISAGDANMTLEYLQSSQKLSAAIIGTNSTVSGDPNDQSSVTGSNTAVAMSILYSITGIITVLFLAIIATGAVRAHRHPERYGPRAGSGGRPRQSRARGIARAMLETIPIVKFGTSEPSKPDPSLELERGLHRDAPPQAEPTATTAIPAETGQEPATPSTPADGIVKPPIAEAETQSQTVPKSTDTSAASQDVAADKQGCSICTEDFTVGEDVRVLPCKHKFHPPCIDPWLVNVAGTCPLCRYDLRPKPSESGEAPEENAQSAEGQLPPPLEADPGDHVGRSNRVSRLFDSRLLDVHRLRHASVEERIETLRRLRTQQQQQQQQQQRQEEEPRSSHGASAAGPAADGTEAAGQADHEERSRRARLTARLRDRFRVRTRTQSPAGETGR